MKSKYIQGDLQELMSLIDFITKECVVALLHSRRCCGPVSSTSGCRRRSQGISKPFVPMLHRICRVLLVLELPVLSACERGENDVVGSEWASDSGHYDNLFMQLWLKARPGILSRGFQGRTKLNGCWLYSSWGNWPPCFWLYNIFIKYESGVRSGSFSGRMLVWSLVPVSLCIFAPAPTVCNTRLNKGTKSCVSIFLDDAACGSSSCIS